MSKTIDLTCGPRSGYQATKDLVAKHFPEEDYPVLLIIDIFTALSEAERRGFMDCLEVIQGPRICDNDNDPKGRETDQR